MIRALVLCLAIGLSACASATMRGYMGEPLQNAMLDYGPPANAFDMPDGSRAFQWVINTTYVTPAYATQTITPIGRNMWMTNTRIDGGQAITSGCVYTMLARWDEAQNTWVFYDFRRPSLGCE